jgi:inositol phosphorylceramide mannosyltransferase catalytic subunit
MIPRVLHQIWMGPKPLPQEWVEAYKLANPSWEHRLWTERAIRKLPLTNLRHFNWYARRGRWNGAADIARVEILHRFGGVYVDVDSEPLLPFDDAPFMGAGFFAGIAEGKRIANGTIGSEAGHPVLTEYIAAIGNHPLTNLLPPSRTIGSVLLTDVVSRHSHMPDVMVMSRRTFYPVSIKGNRIAGIEPAYTNHFWAGTKRLYDVPA